MYTNRYWPIPTCWLPDSPGITLKFIARGVLEVVDVHLTGAGAVRSVCSDKQCIALASGKHIQHLEVLEGWNLWKNSLEHHWNILKSLNQYANPAWSAWTSQLASWGSQLWTSMGRTKQCKPCFPRSYTVKLVPDKCHHEFDLNNDTAHRTFLFGFLSAVKHRQWARSMVQTSTMCNFLHPSWQIWETGFGFIKKSTGEYWQDQWHQWPDVDRHSYALFLGSTTFCNILQQHQVLKCCGFVESLHGPCILGPWTLPCQTHPVVLQLQPATRHNQQLDTAPLDASLKPASPIFLMISWARGTNSNTCVKDFKWLYGCTLNILNKLIILMVWFKGNLQETMDSTLQLVSCKVCKFSLEPIGESRTPGGSQRLGGIQRRLWSHGWGPQLVEDLQAMESLDIEIGICWSWMTSPTTNKYNEFQ